MNKEKVELEDSGPSVDSADPQERILARRIRIAKRNAKLKREQAEKDGELEGAPPEEEEEEQPQDLKQLEESQRRLEKLRNDGFELVTNVKTASDAREMQHYLEESDQKLSRTEKLEAEAKTSADKFKEITGRWSSAYLKEIPQDLHKLLVEQTKSCDMVISDKNKIINQLQMDLKKQDDEYVKDIKKQNESVDLLIERMEEQAKSMTKAYRDEIEQIEQAFIAERANVLQQNRAKWELISKVRRDREVEYSDVRFGRVDDHADQLDTLRTNDTEEYNMVKIKLETDVQILEQQLQQMKATYQLNQEKLEYNFQVLKKRDEENLITKSQQKRKITKMQDQMQKLANKLRKQQQFYKDENQNLTEEYHKIARQYKQLHAKMRNFSKQDWQRFEEIWKMNESEARLLVEKVLLADRIINEQQLGLEWTEPELEFSDNVGPLNKEQETEKSAAEYVQEVLNGSAQSKELEVSLGLTKRILEAVCDEGGFLVEDKLRKLLEPLRKGERSLIKLDAIFKTLRVNTEEDVKKLTSYFLRMLRGIDLGHFTTKSTSNLTAKMNESLDSSLMEGSEDSNFSLEIDDENEVVIERNNVLFVLRSYVEEHILPKKERERPSLVSSFAASLNRDTSRDEKYWRSMARVIKKKKLLVWDAVLESLNKYHGVLQERASRLKENEGLRKQNTELRMLLHQYISSKVNQELEIPPTRVLQFEGK